MADAIEVPRFDERLRVIVYPCPTGAEEPWSIDLASVAKVEELPSRLLVGWRDDASFQRTGDGWRCEYPGSWGMGLDLSCSSGRCVVEQYWAGVRLVSTWPANEGWTGLLRALGPSPPPQAWQQELARALEAAGRFEWIGDSWSGRVPTPWLFLPDGHPICVLFYVRPEFCADLWYLHRNAVEEPNSLPLTGRTLVRPFELRHMLEAGPPPGDDGPEHRELKSRYAVWLERSIGVPQRASWCFIPAKERPNGWSLVQFGRGYLHIYETWLRDLLPLCHALVEAGFVPAREDLSTEDGPAIDLLTRAVVCPAARLLAPLELWSRDGRVKLIHPPLGHDLWGLGERGDVGAFRIEPNPSDN